ncbi:hypothetical protein Tco_0991201 [Tanacetum coccineum]|uniref:Uncharacterized protein n=1 Tax=Tanacetum coccineum TaxID=301880 RepID=A0ABQ5EYY7_9ASTR
MMTQKLGNGFEFIKKACFVCGSFNHLIKDCDFHDNKMVEKPVLSNKGKVTDQREIRPVWNNAQRVNNQNKLTHSHLKRNFVPTAVATKSGQVPVNAAKQSSPRAAASISTVRPVNTVAPKPKVNDALPITYSYFKAHSPVRRAFNQKSAAKTNNFNEKVNTARVNNVTTAGPKGVGNPQYTLQDQGIFNSGCSRHMIGNKSFLTDYQEIDGGFLAFGGSPKGDLPFDLEAFSDSDYVGASLDRKSTTGDGISDEFGFGAVGRKTEGNADFHQIVDFLNASTIIYSLTISPTIYASYIEQFWATAKSKIVNNEMKIHAKFDGKTIVILESSVMSNLHFNDEDGVTSLTNSGILENLALMGYEILEVQRLKRAGQEVLEKPVRRQKIGQASGSGEEQSAEKENELSKEELQKLLVIVLVEELVIQPLQVKYPIIDWEVYSEDTRRFDKDDLVKLWDLVKERYMHDPLVWRLYDTCGVHHVSSVRGHDIFMLVEKEYPLTRGTLGLMMEARLLVEADSEMFIELLRKIFYQANRPRQGVLLGIKASQVSTAGYKSFYCWLKKLLLAEAIAIACFTQNRSLIRKCHNKTPKDLGKLKPKADIEIFISYALAKKAF